LFLEWAKPNKRRKTMLGYSGSIKHLKELFKESKGNVRFLTDEEERVLLKAANEPLRTMILTGIYPGARLQSEALALTWDNVVFKNGFLTIRDAYAKSGGDPDSSARFRVARGTIEAKRRGQGPARFCQGRRKPLPLYKNHV
jgi:integrase